VIFTSTEIEGAYVVDLDRLDDERGFFARSWCRQEFTEQGLVADLVQANIAFTRHQGTLRGMHYQATPHEEAKLVRCTRGAAYVVALDLRRSSPSRTRWVSAELTADNRRALYVPPGCAQGYQTLVGDTEAFYQMSSFYAPKAAKGVRYDDPQFKISWPLPVTMISDRDRDWPDYPLLPS
jgi:dTDP-4-dehydrorhamnose 3,5-epimerase